MIKAIAKLVELVVIAFMVLLVLAVTSPGWFPAVAMLVIAFFGLEG